MKTPAVSSTEKTRSHLPPNLTAKDRARKYPEDTFHVDDGLLFCSSYNYLINPFLPQFTHRCLIIVPLCLNCL